MNPLRRSTRRATRAFGLAAILLGIGAAPAAAVPALDVQLTRDEAEFPIVYRSDERVDYTVRVSNTASTTPSAGDELTCDLPLSVWNGNFETTDPFTYEWRRNGVVIPGETSQTYTLISPDDDGKVIQCLVKGSSAFSSVKYASTPGLVADLQPATAPPNAYSPTARPTIFPFGLGTDQRTCSPSTELTISATATTNATDQLTSVVTARGTATVSSTTNPNVLTSVNPTGGRFIVGQTVTITGFAAGTTITAIDSVNRTLTLSNPATSGDGTGKTITAGSQPFQVGEEIVGAGIPAGTTITAISGQTITMSNAATASATLVGISSASTGTWSYQWLRDGEEIAGATSSTYTPVIATGTANRSILATGTANRTALATGTGVRTKYSPILTGLTTTTGTFTVGASISGTGILNGTTIAAIDTGAGTLTLSKPALSGSGSTTTITSGSRTLTNVTNAATFSVGESISGTGILDFTTITAVDTGAGTLTLSKGVTGTGTGTAINSGSRTLTNVTTITGTFAVGDRITGAAGILAGTRIVAVDTGAGTITLDTGVTSAGTAGAITGGIDNGRALQCQVVGANPGGRLVGISDRTGANQPSGLPSTTTNPTTQFSNSTTGPVTVEFELPAGQGTYPYRILAPDLFSPPTGWSCSQTLASGPDPAKVTCTRSDVLQPNASYPVIVVVAFIGADAPDPALAQARVSGGGSADDSADLSLAFAPARVFGIESFDTFVTDEVGTDYTQAGGHPFMVGEVFGFTHKRGHPTPTFGPRAPEDQARAVAPFRTTITDTPRGFVGNALAIKELCPSILDVYERTCPTESIVGRVDIRFQWEVALSGLPVYALEPEFGRPAQFAIYVGTNNSVVVFYPRLRAEDGYAMSFESAPVPALPYTIDRVDVTLCGFGVKPNTGGGGNLFGGCKRADEPDPDGSGPLTGANPKPLVTNPTKCTGDPPKVTLRADSWQSPGDYVSAESIDPLPTNCAAVRFEPEMSLEPTSQRADSPTGMDVEIFMPTDGLESKTGIAQSTMKRVTVTFPEGMAPNPAFAHGLGSCSSAQVGIDPDTGVPDNEEARCPDSSKIGTVEIDTPIINGTFTGDVFLAKQGADNPFDSNLAMYMVFSQKRFGITVKVAGEVKPDPVTGRLTVVFDENPEWPFSSIRLNFPQGSRSPLLNPPMCGSYDIRAEITPWAAADPDNPTPAETITQISTYEVTEGPNGGPCPPNNLEPKFNAGTINPVAGATSPFVMRLQRDDGTQRFTGLTLSPPQGLTAYLKGIPYCSDSALAAISPNSETGQAQFDSPSCPAASQIGTTAAGAGAGDNPFYVNTGRLYLAGPYRGAPLSVAAVVPVLAGPFDLGSIVTRVALHVNPRTAEIKAVSDPIPAIWHGILVDVRDLRVNVDRQGFMLNPTSCAEKSVGATITGAGDDIASTGDDSTAEVSNRFQVGDCAALDFKPRMTLRLRGGTKRGKHPALTATLEPGPGNANIANISVALPRSEFLENAHIRTVCTRPDFAADNCPAGAIYGRATVWTPLLDEPLTGPVYLRSSSNLLPDLVPDLRGPESQPIRIESSGRTDSVRGGIRNTFDFVPDAPFTRFVLRMQGGRKGLLVNSRDICRRAYRATVKAGAHNGRTIVLKPKLQAPCGKKGKRRASRGR